MNTVYLKWLSGDVEELKIDTSDTSDTSDTIRHHLRDRRPRNHILHIVKDDVEDDSPIFNVLCAPEVRMTPDECLQVEKHLEKYFGSTLRFPTFRQFLVEAHAVVAGGAIVSAFGDFPINDVDIYVPLANARIFYKELKELFGFCVSSDIFRPQSNTFYDPTFLRENQILFRIPLLSTRGSLQTMIDLIVVKDERCIDRTLTNFDVSFCESWWDGCHLYSNDPDGLRQRNGWLKEPYVKRMMIDLNLSTIHRVRKYRKRGWTVNVDWRCLGTDETDEREDNDKNIWCAQFFLLHAFREIYSHNEADERNKCVEYFFKFLPHSTQIDVEAIVKEWTWPVVEILASRISSSVCDHMNFLPDEYHQRFKEVFRVGQTNRSSYETEHILAAFRLHRESLNK